MSIVIPVTTLKDVQGATIQHAGLAKHFVLTAQKFLVEPDPERLNQLPSENLGPYIEGAGSTQRFGRQENRETLLKHFLPWVQSRPPAPRLLDLSSGRVTHKPTTNDVSIDLYGFVVQSLKHAGLNPIV
jgi:hypothetical protein